MEQWVTLADCRNGAPVFTVQVEETAQRLGLPERQLAVRSLLLLPRVADTAGRISLAASRREIGQAAKTLTKDLVAYRQQVAWPQPANDVSDLVFGALDTDVARLIFGKLHYLKCYREDSEAYALFAPDTHLPLAACTVSPLQWSALGGLLERTIGVPAAAVMDVSRVFAFDAAPKNSISALLSRVRKAVRASHPEVALLSTVVDQNLGFSGRSYLAANWQHWAEVEARPYLYVDGEYKTIRQVHVLFGEQRWEELAANQGVDFTISQALLLRSLIFIQPVGHLPAGRLGDQIHVLQRGGYA